MATFDEIKTVRLTIDDPPGFIDFVEVATTADLPAAPLAQTAYKVTANGGYYSTDIMTGAVEADYDLEELSISDSALSATIDASGIEEATRQGYYALMRKLGKQLTLVRNSEGAETTEYQRLIDLYNYYKKICADYEDEKAKIRGLNTGRYFSTPDPIIGEGNV